MVVTYEVYQSLKWATGYKNEAFWSGKGKPSTQLILGYLLQEELVRADKKYGAGCVRDLWEAYEVVKWEPLAKEAQALKFPMKINHVS